MLMWTILLWTLIVVNVECIETGSHVTDLTKDNYDAFIGAKAVTMVYFHNEAQGYPDEISPYKVFRDAYQKAAELLALYDVKFGQVDCTAVNENDIPSCAIRGVEGNVFAYRGGEELLDLALDTMFDVNSIMSNVLQLVLLREVPIVQKPEELINLKYKMRGKQDIIFSYQSAIGTYEHRILMEVAFAYHEHFKFAITTEKAVVDEVGHYNVEGNAAIWVLHCKKTTEEDVGCQSAQYESPMDLYSLSTYLKLLHKPIKPVHDIIDDGTDIPYTANKMHQVYLYYNTGCKSMVKEVAKEFADVYHSTIGVVTVDVDTVKDTAHLASPGKLPPYMAFYALNQAPIVMGYEFRKARIVEFVDYELSKFLHKDEKQSSSYTTNDVLEDLEDQDDEVGHNVHNMRYKEIELGAIPALTDKTFPTTIRDVKLLLVLFYVNFDPRSMAFLRSHGVTAKQLASEELKPYARVNCFDWTDVCKKNNITSYPTIRIYRRGKQPEDYKGLLDGAAVANAVKMYMAKQPFPLHSIEEVEDFTKGNLPESISSHTHTAVLGLFSGKSSDEMTAFTEAAKQMHGKLVFGLAKDEVAKEMAEKYGSQLPSIVVVKRDDPLQPHQLFRQVFTTARILQFVMEAKLPIFPELTPANFPAYHAKQQPLAIVFTREKSDSLMDSVKAIVKSGQFSGTTFSYMNLNGNKVAEAVLAKYENSKVSKLTTPAVALVNHKMGTVHTYSKKDHSEEAITKWLRECNAGNVKPTTTLSDKEWKPVNPGYDFLQMMDEEAKSKDKRHPMSQRYESVGENGKALDADGNEVDEGFPDQSAEEAKLHAELEYEIRNDLKASRLFHKAEKKAEAHKHEHTEL